MGIHKFSPFEFDSGTGRLQKYGLRIKLQQKPQIVLAALLEEPGKTVSRQELYKRLWPDGIHVDFEQGLSVAVKKLRDALCDASDTPSYIATVPGTGYRFIGSVEQAGLSETSQLGDISTADSDQQSLAERAAGEQNIGPYRTPRIVLGRAAAAVAVGVVVLGALLFVFARSFPGLHVVSTRSLIMAPTDWLLLTTQDIGGSIALSPDGTQAVFGASNTKAGPMLLLRKMGSLDTQPIAGSERAAMPFWSPDGHKIAFFADDKLKTIDLASGAVRIVCAVAESPRGGSWGPDDTILLVESTRGPIMRVPAGGGRPKPVSTLTDSQYTTHRWPEFLPDGKHFLFFAASHEPVSPTRPAIFLGSLDGTPPRRLVESDSNALFVAGELLFVSGGKLLGQSLDLGSGKVGSAARVLTDNVEYDQALWHAAFTATQQFLVFRERPETPETQLIAFVDATGKEVKIASRPGRFRSVSVSPDGETLAAMCDDPTGNICLIHPDGSITRISDSPLNWLPAWSPDGLSLAYSTHRGSRQFSLVVKDAKGQKPERVLMESEAGLSVSSWAPNQKELLVERPNAKGNTELAIFRFSDRTCRTFLSANFNVKDGRFSPDARWVAFQSDESGRDEIYITSYPDGRRKYRVSALGGRAPRWGGSSREIYFLDSTEMIQHVQIAMTAHNVKMEQPEPAFRPSILAPPYDSHSFDVARKKLLFVTNRDATRNSSGYVLVTSWR